MERHRILSQASIDRRSSALKDSSNMSLNKQNQLQNEIDQLIQNGILDPIVRYDPKLDFTYVPIVTRDQVLKQTRRQTCGLIWNSIRSPTVSRLVREDRSCAFVEILQIPQEWSRYDADIFLLKLRQKNFLNGLALRDEFVRILQYILKRDFKDSKFAEKKYAYELKDVEFTRNTIQLVFASRQDLDLTLIVTLVILLEFDVSCKEFFPEAYTSLSYHEDLNEYLQYHIDMSRTRVTPHNSIKFLFDYTLTEANLCEYLLPKSNPLSVMLTNFLKLRKEWLKYVQRAAKHATETIKIQVHTEKQRQSICSVNSVRSGTSNASSMNKITQNKVSLTTEVEVAFEILFSISIIRLLFFAICSKYKKFGMDYENDVAFAIEKSLHIFGDALESSYLEHPLLPNVNILPDSILTHDITVKVAIKKLIKDMQKDWKRNLRR